MATWHPILEAQEYEPGKWVIFDARQQPFAAIEFIRRGPELGYRATRWKQDPPGGVIGYYKSLMGAASAVHRVKINVGVPTMRHPLEGHRGVGKANTPARMERD